MTRDGVLQLRAGVHKDYLFFSFRVYFFEAVVVICLPFFLGTFPSLSIPRSSAGISPQDAQMCVGFIQLGVAALLPTLSRPSLVSLQRGPPAPFFLVLGLRLASEAWLLQWRPECVHGK